MKAHAQGPAGWNRGEANVKAKLTRVDVERLRARAAAGVPLQKLALDFGISDHQVRKILRRECWA